MTDDPNTKDQAEALLKEYYAKDKAKEAPELPKKPVLLSWRLREDGVMIVVDGASGRKLEFQPEKPKSAPQAKGKGK